MLQQNSLAQHWARDWRALVLTQVHQKNIKLPGTTLGTGLKREQQLANAKRPEKGGDSVGPIQAAEEGMPLAESDSDPHSPKGCGQKDGAAPLTE